MTAAAYGALLDALRGVTWPARRPAGAGAAGTHQSTLRGLAAEFTEYRPYRQGDDPRRLDWKLLARTDRAYFRLSDDHVTLRTLLIADSSASMNFAAPDAGKWRLAALLTAGLASLAHASGDPVGLAVAGRRLARVPARSRRGVVGEIIRALDTVEPGGAAALAPAIRGATAFPRMVVVSDFLDRDVVAGELGRAVAAGCEVHAVHVVAREELDPSGRFLAVDPEDDALRRPMVPESIEQYQQAFGAWRREVQDTLRRAGVSVTEVVTDEAPERAVRRIVSPA